MFTEEEVYLMSSVVSLSLCIVNSQNIRHTVSLVQSAHLTTNVTDRATLSAVASYVASQCSTSCKILFTFVTNHILFISTFQTKSKYCINC